MRAKIFRRGRGVINLKNWKVSFFGSSCGRSAYSGGTKKITFAVFWDQMLPKWPKNNWKSSFLGGRLRAGRQTQEGTPKNWKSSFYFYFWGIFWGSLILFCSAASFSLRGCRVPSKALFTAKHLTVFSLFRIVLSKRRAEKIKRKLVTVRSKSSFICSNSINRF